MSGLKHERPSMSCSSSLHKTSPQKNINLMNRFAQFKHKLGIGLRIELTTDLF